MERGDELTDQGMYVSVVYRGYPVVCVCVLEGEGGSTRSDKCKQTDNRQRK